MYGLLDLNPGGPVRGGRGRVSMVVQPTVSVDELLKTLDIRTFTASVVVGVTSFFTIPDDEQWELLVISGARAAGDRDVGTVDLLEPANLGAAAIAVVQQAAGSSVFRVFEKPMPLQPGWALRLVGEGGTTDGNWSVGILVHRKPSWLT